MEIWKQIEHDYNQGLSINQICKKYNSPDLSIYPNKVSNYLKSQSIKVINRQNCEKVDDVTLLSMYNNGMSIKQITLKVKSSDTIISKRLKDLGVRVINKQNNRGVNHTLFEVIDTSEKAYWLGFLYADGCIHSSKNIIELSLKPGDVYHLIKFKKFIGANNKISISKNRCRYTFSSGKIKSDLIRHGCGPNKSLILEFPNQSIFQNNKIVDFIRGYFDGDGCITYDKRKGNIIKPIVSIVGTISFLSGIQNFFGFNYKLYNKKGSSNKVYSLTINGKNTQLFLNTIYYNDTKTYLDRKYKRFQIFKKFNFAVPYSDIRLITGQYR